MDCFQKGGKKAQKIGKCYEGVAAIPKRSRIRDLQLSEARAYLDPIRDMFLFCRFSGLRHSDTDNQRKSDIKGLRQRPNQLEWNKEKEWIQPIKDISDASGYYPRYSEGDSPRYR